MHPATVPETSLPAARSVFAGCGLPFGMFKPILLSLVVLLAACGSTLRLKVPEPQGTRTGGSSFYLQAAGMNWKSRDSLALQEVLAGNIPGFLLRMVPVHVQITDSTTGLPVRATYYVSPDYLSIGYARKGRGEDWARICITPMAAQQIADSFHCFLPTRKMVDDIYSAAAIKAEPIPLFAFRDSTPTMWHHHLMIEGQRKQQKGLIAGIKKDVVISTRVITGIKQDRVAIYGWHRPGGKPIQPLYTGHVNWYVDYSHGIRLVYRSIRIGKQWYDYTFILQHPIWRKLLCDEPACDFFRYNY